MSTHALVTVENEKGQKLVKIWNHFDGYPKGLGLKIKAFFGGDYDIKRFENFGCIAAGLVKYLADNPDSSWIEPIGTSNIGERYIYFVYPAMNNTIIYLQCLDCYMSSEVYRGPIADFDP